MPPGRADAAPVLPIFRTPRLEEDVAGQLQQRALAAVATVPRDLLARAEAFLLISDSRASFTIEGERPPHPPVPDPPGAGGPRLSSSKVIEH